MPFGVHFPCLYSCFPVFRSFNNGPDPKYIVIYVGNWHKKNLDNLFKGWGMTYIGGNKSDIENKDFQCLRIGLKLQFFKS